MRIFGPGPVGPSRQSLDVWRQPRVTLPNSAVVEDFIERFYPSGRNMLFRLGNQMIQSTTLNVVFDPAIPRIRLNLREPSCKFTLLDRRKLFNLGSDIC